MGAFLSLHLAIHGSSYIHQWNQVLLHSGRVFEAEAREREIHLRHEEAPRPALSEPSWTSQPDLTFAICFQVALCWSVESIKAKG